MYKTLQLFTNSFTLNTNKFTSIKIILKTHMYRHKVIKNAKLIKAGIKLKLFIVLSLMKQCLLTLTFFKSSKTLYDINGFNILIII